MADVDFRFSEHFGIKRGKGDDWFDPLLVADIKLFVDPFRVYAANDTVWKGAHDELIDFFNLVLELVARSGLSSTSAHWRAAQRLLMFPEPAEFCLGYGDTPLGQGSGPGLREAMMRVAKTTIELGFESVEHFEEMVLFQEQIGPDRVSDAVCNILKGRFIAYTQSVAKRHKVPLDTIDIPHSSWSREQRRWESAAYELPRNPYTGRAVLLTPKRFLRQLPVFTGDDFWDWAFAHEADQIKHEFNYDVASNIKGREVAKLARRHPDLARRFIRGFEDQVPDAYDVVKDPKGVVNWYEAGEELATFAKTIQSPESAKDFCS